MNIQFRKTCLVRFIGIVTLLVLVLVLSSSVVASSGTMYIYEDTTLSENHHGSIEIMADDVKLNCDGHSVIGSGSGTGIDLSNRTGVTVKNCKVTNFTWGFFITFSSNNVLKENTANNNTDQGFVLQDFSDGNILKENTANNNGYAGFYLRQASNNVLKENTANYNSTNGFVLENSDGNLLKENTASNTEIYSGFYLRQSSNNILRENIASGNSYAGIVVAQSSTNNNISENVATGNGGGMGTWSSADNNRFTENVAENNSYSGFLINTSSGSEWIDNVSIGNLEGFTIRRSSGHLLRGNSAVGNITDGYTFAPVIDSFDNTLIENSAEDNHRYGFYLNNYAYRTNLMFNTGCRNHVFDAWDESSPENMNLWSDNEFCDSYDPASTSP